MPGFYYFKRWQFLGFYMKVDNNSYQQMMMKYIQEC